MAEDRQRYAKKLAHDRPDARFRRALAMSYWTAHREAEAKDWFVDAYRYSKAKNHLQGAALALFALTKHFPDDELVEILLRDARRRWDVSPMLFDARLTVKR